MPVGGAGDINETLTAGKTYYVVVAGCGLTAGNYVLQTFVTPWMGIDDPGLITLVQQLFARDGQLTRADMIQILDYTVSNPSGTLSAMDLNDLKTIVKNDAGYFKLANYVRVLSDDVVLGNSANQYYTGGTNFQPATYLPGSGMIDPGATPPAGPGDLKMGSTAADMKMLVGKWFLGTDLPDPAFVNLDPTETMVAGIDPLQYAAFTGPLYSKVAGVPTPVLTDVQQGGLGDCYFLATLAGIANANPTAIENMIFPNGDGTWTVRFYNNGVADYVTVNNELPIVSAQLAKDWTGTVGGLAYNGAWTILSSSDSTHGLWLALVEKAYAQWNEVGAEQHGAGLDGENAYGPIAGGFSQPVMDQVLGPTDMSKDAQAGAGGFTAADDQTIIQAEGTKGDVVTGGTIEGLNSMYTSDNLIVEGHEYTVVAASAASITVHNPWGNAPDDNFNVPPVKTQPPPLPWANFNVDFDEYSIATTLNSQPFLLTSTTGTGSGTTTSNKEHLPKFLGFNRWHGRGQHRIRCGQRVACTGQFGSELEERPAPARGE